MSHPVLPAITFSLLLFSLWGATSAGAREKEPDRNDTGTLIENTQHLSALDPEKERRYRAALEQAPSNPRLLFNLALLLQAGGRYAEAIPLYRDVLKQNPDDAITHYNLANVLLALDDPGNWQSSAWHFRQFIFYADSNARIDKARKALQRLEANLASLYSPYRNTHLSRTRLIEILGRPGYTDNVRGSSKYDGPRVPLMLNFAVQSAELTAAARQQLDDVAAALKISTLQNEHIQIEGYTDSHEHPEFEVRMRYAGQRAERVKQYFQQVHGLPAEHFTTRAFADLEIISANNTPQGRAANRRVELYNLSRGHKVAAPLYSD